MIEPTDSQRCAARALARVSLARFNRWMFVSRRRYLWQQASHHEAICDALEGVFEGRIKRLIINVPPRYSKTELVKSFVGWAMGQVPDSEWIYTSYSGRLAAAASFDVRSMLGEPEYRATFPGVELRDDSQAKDEWRTTAGGLMYAVGSGGTITGYGAGKHRPGFGGAIIIDDPHKADEARSDVMRGNVIDWYKDTLQSRLNSPDTPIIYIGQRLHENDLAGWLLAGGSGEAWTHVCFPAIQVDGTALWPEKHTIEDLRRLEQAMPYTFAGQYMQRPAPAEGGLFKPDHIQVVDALPMTPIQWVRGWDLASTTDGDWTAGAKLGRLLDGRFVIADMTRLRAGPDERDEAIRNTAARDTVATKISIPQDPGQAGKPIWECELILMADGSRKELRDIVIGDLVIGKDGRPHNVSAVFIQGDLPTCKLTTESGREIVAALDHPFLTPDGWVNAGDLQIGDTLALSSCPETTGKSNRSLNEFRLAGYFIGDGTVGRPAKAGENGSCHAEFTCADSVQLDDFTACVESLGGSVVPRKNPIQFGTKGLQQWLRDTDIAGKTAYDKRIPAWVFNGSAAQVANFLGAYFACDGTISKAGDEIVYYSVSKELLLDVQHLLLRLGISSTLKRKNGKYLETRHESWLLRMRQQDDAYGRFARRIPFHHSGKQDRLAAVLSAARFRRFDEQLLPDRVVAIDDAGMMPCRCLTVDDVHSFLVHDVIVHNTQVLYLTRQLLGYRVESSPESGDKVTRAEPFAAQVNVGNVLMLRGGWNDALLEEMRMFPNGSFDDQVDALSRAFSHLIGAGLDLWAKLGK